jgi:hypothetical protein
MATPDRINGRVGGAPEAFQPRFGSREEHIAYNEAWSRSLNERRAERALGPEAMASFRCECWRHDCAERIKLSREEWKLVRAEPSRFAVAPDHVAENFEGVIKAFPHFWLIEKFGQAGEIAARLSSSDLRLTRWSAYET